MEFISVLFHCHTSKHPWKLYAILNFDEILFCHLYDSIMRSRKLPWLANTAQ